MKLIKPMKLAWFCLLAAGLTVTQNAVAQEEASKPNVVLMLSDNVGYGDIGAFQGGAIRSFPHRKSIALRTKAWP